MSMLVRLMAPLLLAAGVAVAGTAAATAAPGTALTNANVRTGPGIFYPVIGQLTAGQYVVVQGCTPSWCKVHMTNVDGWVFRALIANPYVSRGPYYQFPPYQGPGPGRYLGTPDKPL